LADRVQGEQEAASVISVRADDEIFMKAAEMVQKEKAEEVRTGKFQAPTGETAKDIAEIDRLFESFFWREINPGLKQPLIPGLQNTSDSPSN
jgi:hypothetical protein